MNSFPYYSSVYASTPPEVEGAYDEHKHISMVHFVAWSSIANALCVEYKHPWGTAFRTGAYIIRTHHHFLSEQDLNHQPKDEVILSQQH